MSDEEYKAIIERAYDYALNKPFKGTYPTEGEKGRLRKHCSYLVDIYHPTFQSRIKGDNTYIQSRGHYFQWAGSEIGELDRCIEANLTRYNNPNLLNLK